MVISDFIDWYRDQYLELGERLKGVCLEAGAVAAMFECGKIGCFAFGQKDESSEQITVLVDRCSKMSLPVPASLGDIKASDIPCKYRLASNWSAKQAYFTDVSDGLTWVFHSKFQKAI